MRDPPPGAPGNSKAPRRPIRSESSGRSARDRGISAWIELIETRAGPASRSSRRASTSGAWPGAPRHPMRRTSVRVVRRQAAEAREGSGLVRRQASGLGQAQRRTGEGEEGTAWLAARRRLLGSRRAARTRRRVCRKSGWIASYYIGWVPLSGGAAYQSTPRRATPAAVCSGSTSSDPSRRWRGPGDGHGPAAAMAVRPQAQKPVRPSSGAGQAGE